jgi:predicted SprT family Zn-dependent metalloprotease
MKIEECKIHPKLKELVKMSMDEWLERLEAAFPKVKIKNNRIKYWFFRGSSKKCSVLGGVKYNKNEVAFNADYLNSKKHLQQMLQITVPHELAHIFCYRLYNEKGHGKKWKSIMKTIGVDDHAKFRF